MSTTKITICGLQLIDLLAQSDAAYHVDVNELIVDDVLSSNSTEYCVSRDKLKIQFTIVIQGVSKGSLFLKL